MSDKCALADRAIDATGLIQSLEGYNPTVVSTIHADLDIANSDIDIICCYSDKNNFVELINSLEHSGVSDNIEVLNYSVVWKFFKFGFQFEIYGSETPVSEQHGYIHYSVMLRLVEIGGVEFQKAVRSLKSNGLKTEPAISSHLNLVGDPYLAVLEIAKMSDEELRELVKA